MTHQIAKSQTTIKGLLEGDDFKLKVAEALPKHLKAERFIRVAVSALNKTPKLRECTQQSFFKCMIDLSSYGLEPDGRRAHLIPYGKECTLIIDYKGLAELAMRSGVISKLHSDVVCENDIFEYNMGTVESHKIDFKKPRGEAYAVYAIAETKDGAMFSQVMTKDEVEAVRQSSRGKNATPWTQHWNEMAKKTVFRRLSKWLPLSAEFRDAVEKDDEDNFQPKDVTPKESISFAVQPDEKVIDEETSDKSTKEKEAEEIFGGNE